MQTDRRTRACAIRESPESRPNAATVLSALEEGGGRGSPQGRLGIPNRVYPFKRPLEIRGNERGQLIIAVGTPKRESLGRLHHGFNVSWR